MLAGIYVLAEPIMRIVAGKEFPGSAEILRILSFAIFGIAIGNIFGYLILAINKQKPAIFIYLSDAVFSTIGYFYFIPKYGIYGAAGVAIFSELYAGMGLLLLSCAYASHWPKFKNFIKILIASFGMGTVIFYLQPRNIVVSILLGAAIYAVLIFALRVASKQMVSEILKKD